MKTSQSPMEFFTDWFLQAKNHKDIKDHTAMALATATKDATPSIRTVLLKDYDKKNATFTFFTNLTSQKAVELSQNPFATMHFYWDKLGKQIRIEGKVTAVSNQIANKYFASRSRDSQISAWASDQSSKLENYQVFLDKIKNTEEKFKNIEITRPPFWSGYLLTANKIEFWLNEEFRRHKRFLFSKNNNNWQKDLLYP